MPRLFALVFALALWPHAATERTHVRAGTVIVGESSCFVADLIERDPEHAQLGTDPVIVQSEPNRSAAGSDGRHVSSIAPFRTVLLLGASAERRADGESLRPRGCAARAYDATAPPAH